MLMLNTLVTNGGIVKSRHRDRTMLMLNYSKISILFLYYSLYSLIFQYLSKVVPACRSFISGKPVFYLSYLNQLLQNSRVFLTDRTSLHTSCNTLCRLNFCCIPPNICSLNSSLRKIPAEHKFLLHLFSFP